MQIDFFILCADGQALKHKHDATVLAQTDDLQVYNKQMIYKA